MLNKIENIYTSVACNRTSGALDWNKANQICFAAKHAVAIYEETNKEIWKITKLLVKHTDRVNTVKWIYDKGNQNVIGIISGSDDKCAIIWNFAQSSVETTDHTILKGHDGSVTVVDAIQNNDQNLLVGTTGSDFSIKLWKGLLHGPMECIQTIDLAGHLSFALRLIPLCDTNKHLLVYTTDDCKLSLMTESTENLFSKTMTLVGHEDWILGLDYTIIGTSILLASSSQDTFIRLWKITKIERRDETEVVSKLTLDIEREDRRFTLMNEANDQITFSVSLESVLQGHDNWVTSVAWYKNSNNGQLHLLSSSADKTLIIWELGEDGIWIEKIRTGEVGGNTFGFFGAKFSPNGTSIIGHAYYGSLHKWNQSINNDRLWNPGVVISGHFAEVQDIVWEPEGKFLCTVSYDQTTRIHTPWVRDGLEVLWHELARPQIHGYDMHCCAMISRYRFGSGAEEKIVRIFDAPVNFVENFRSITNTTDDKEGDLVLATSSKGASRPTLGLSNRAVNESTIIDTTELRNNEYPEHYFVETKFTEPPKEETLMQNTLWPETQKLYGHDGYEVFSITCSHNGKILASACKATTADHAQILLWDTNTWKIITKLKSHQLTVTQMKFSSDDKFLLSVSRDRKWSLFENMNYGDGCDFILRGATGQKNGVHARIIWTCDWARDSRTFITGSRDKKVVAWRIGDTNEGDLAGVTCLSTMEAEADVTSLAVSHNNRDDSSHLIAIGLGCGVISLYNLSNEGKWTHLHRIAHENAHHLPVKRLTFRPNNSKIQLASCSDDHFVKIFEINL